MGLGLVSGMAAWRCCSSVHSIALRRGGPRINNPWDGGWRRNLVDVLWPDSIQPPSQEVVAAARARAVKLGVIREGRKRD